IIYRRGSESVKNRRDAPRLSPMPVQGLNARDAPDDGLKARSTGHHRRGRNASAEPQGPRLPPRAKGIRQHPGPPESPQGRISRPRHRLSRPLEMAKGGKRQLRRTDANSGEPQSPAGRTRHDTFVKPDLPDAPRPQPTEHRPSRDGSVSRTCKPRGSIPYGA